MNSIPILYPTGIAGDLALLASLEIAGLGKHLDIVLKVEKDRHAISQFGVITTGITGASEASIISILGIIALSYWADSVTFSPVFKI